jgi:putative flippase GtrA
MTANLFRDVSFPLFAQRLVKFVTVGLVSTFVFIGLYILLRTTFVPSVSNAVSLGVTMFGNFYANRVYTFERPDGTVSGQFSRYTVSYLAGFIASIVFVGAVLSLSHPRAGVAEVLAVCAGNGVATITRFVLLSAWVFRTPGA